MNLEKFTGPKYSKELEDTCHVFICGFFRNVSQLVTRITCLLGIHGTRWTEIGSGAQSQPYMYHCTTTNFIEQLKFILVEQREEIISDRSKLLW